MSKQKYPKVPARMSRLERRLAAWRKKRTQGQRIPEPLWKSAASLASEYGIARTSKVLKLNHEGLKKHIRQYRVESTSSGPFIELPPAAIALSSECVIEWENAAGARMRMHLKGTEVPDVLSLGRDFWSVG